MQLSIESRHLGGDVVVIVPQVAGDARGFFSETWRADQFAALGLPSVFRQDNHSGSARNVVRGLHFQYEPPMGKLMRVSRGTAMLVAVDVRVGSPTLGKWIGIESSAENRRQVWAPAGFARGFCVLSDFAEVQYKCTAEYSPASDVGIRWDDPGVGVTWPVADPILSDRDIKAPTLAEWLARPEAQRVRYEPAAPVGGRAT